MKKSILLLLLLITISCDLPSEPTGIKVVYEYHQDTEDFCRGIDVSNGVLVAAASSNGYFRFNIIDEGNNPILEKVVHLPDIDDNVGDDSVFDVLISNNASDIALILDDVDNILVDEFDSGNIELLSQSHCGNSYLYRSIAVNDDVPGSTILFTLQKHFDVVPNDYDAYSTSIGTREYFTEYIDQFGILDTLFYNNPSCVPLSNPNIEAMELFYADDLLTVTQGPYVKIYEYKNNVQLTETFTDIIPNDVWEYIEGFDDVNGNGVWDDGEEFIDCGYTQEFEDLNGNNTYDAGEKITVSLNFAPCDDDDQASYDFIVNENFTGFCCGDGVEVFPPNGVIDFEPFTDHNDDDVCCGSYIGDSLEEKQSFYLQGGEANCTYSMGNIVIGGFSNYRGCYMALLDSNGDINSNLTFANGYSISAIGYDETSTQGLLALGAGNDGVILYNWDGGMSVSLKGIIDVGKNNYVFDVEVVGDNIYVASENGITIYKVEG